MSRATKHPPPPGSYNFVLRSLRFDPRHKRQYRNYREALTSRCIKWRGRKHKGGRGWDSTCDQMMVFCRFVESRGRIVKLPDGFEDVTDQWNEDLRAAESDQQTVGKNGTVRIHNTDPPPPPPPSKPVGPPLARTLNPANFSVRELEKHLLRSDDRDRYAQHLDRYLEMERKGKDRIRAKGVIERAIRARDRLEAEAAESQTPADPPVVDDPPAPEPDAEPTSDEEPTGEPPAPEAAEPPDTTSEDPPLEEAPPADPTVKPAEPAAAEQPPA